MMSEPTYLPAPLDTASIELPSDLVALTERLAENTHDLWARERIAQGWKHGLKRDDGLKEHPGLVAYEALPESEKVFDRNTAMGTLKAILALGYKIEPSGEALGPSRTADLEAWKKRLEEESASAKDDGPRRWTFDMDDQPELDRLDPGRMSQARRALEELQTRVHPVWKEEDAKALLLQRWHHWTATLAIWPGIFAILCAILQLTARWIIPQAQVVIVWLAHFETWSVIVAALAVLAGLFFHLHHGWLACRQRAERLRILKFQALSWPELWSDFEAWKSRLANRVQTLRQVTTKAAHRWAKERDLVRPELPTVPRDVPAEDLEALSFLYLKKRLDFQRHYFEHQAGKAHRSSWFVDRRLGLWIFGLSVVIVLLHGFHLLPHAHLPEGQAPYNAPRADVIEILAISLAAILPVIGFGFRAWFAAFETPRSRNLYRAKALALDEFIRRSSAHTNAVEQTLHQIAHGEHFFTNEHREWCRLQLEAEWFV